jgi:hypothetical protein
MIRICSNRGGKLGLRRSGEAGALFEDGFEDDAGRFSGKRQSAGSHFINDHAEREQIGTGIEFTGADLFRRHVGDGTQHGAGTGEVFVGKVKSGGGMGCGLLVERELGKAEVE